MDQQPLGLLQLTGRRLNQLHAPLDLALPLGLTKAP